MALFLSGSMTSATGSVGGMTYSHNRAGLYMRARRVPVNTNTPSQQDARGALGSASGQWRLLTEAQRVAWAAYAAATPHQNALGQSIRLTGQQAFVAVTAFRLQVGGLVDDFTAAPSIAGNVPIGAATIILDTSASTIVVNGMGADVNNAAVFLGDAIGDGVSFFNGPYQLRGFSTPASGDITISAASGRNGAAFAADQRIPFRIRGQAIDGRLSTVLTGITTVVP